VWEVGVEAVFNGGAVPPRSVIAGRAKVHCQTAAHHVKHALEDVKGSLEMQLSCPRIRTCEIAVSSHALSAPMLRTSAWQLRATPAEWRESARQRTKAGNRVTTPAISVIANTFIISQS
jgi:hypothetical protein